MKLKVTRHFPLFRFLHESIRKDDGYLSILVNFIASYILFVRIRKSTTSLIMY